MIAQCRTDRVCGLANMASACRTQSNFQTGQLCAVGPEATNTSFGWSTVVTVRVAKEGKGSILLALLARSLYLGGGG